MIEAPEPIRGVENAGCMWAEPVYSGGGKPNIGELWPPDSVKPRALSLFS